MKNAGKWKDYPGVRNEAQISTIDHLLTFTFFAADTDHDGNVIQQCNNTSVTSLDTDDGDYDGDDDGDDGQISWQSVVSWTSHFGTLDACHQLVSQFHL